MKAKDYFEKYCEQIMTNDHVVTELIHDLADEYEKISMARHCLRDVARLAVLKELNQKWNAICSLFEIQYGVSPLKRDGFKEHCKASLPELTIRWT